MNTIWFNDLTLFILFIIAQVAVLTVMVKYANKKYSDVPHYHLLRYVAVFIFVVITTPDSVVINAIKIIQRFLNITIVG